MKRVIKKVKSVNDLHVASDGRLIMQHFYLLRFISGVLEKHRAKSEDFRKQNVKANKYKSIKTK